mgnify:CR=1 FL=1
MRRLLWAAVCLLVLVGLTLPVGAFELETPFFTGKRVMVLVPHQDDELNLAGSLLEQYTGAGSEVFLVYATNGDYSGLAQLRSHEALAVARSVGIPAENVIYLGYGNQWQPQGEEKHLYFSSDGDRVWTSHFGATATYGTDAIAPWRGSAYTRDNFLRDLTELLLELRPDVIYCSDYDAHHDHMALDLFFEEVMGNILKTRTDYRPTVYKGFCYGTAWYAPADFLEGDNLRSTVHPDGENWDRLGICYDWDSRVRLPISGEDLSRSLPQTRLYRSVRLFSSQKGHRFAEGMLNGDKVFWERRTDSLLYRAEFLGDGERVTVWNDFKLKDSRDFSALVNTGVRSAGTIAVTLPGPQAMDTLRLYAAPGGASGGYLEFPDGTRVDFGPLDPGGTDIFFPARTVDAFALHLTGDTGLTEIEAYLGAPSAEPQLLMAADENGDFAYDYRMPPDGSMAFSLWSYPAGTGWSDVTVTMTGDVEWSLEEGVLRVLCPPGKSAAFTVTAGEGVSTTFTVCNPSGRVRRLSALWSRFTRDAALALDELLCAQ